MYPIILKNVRTPSNALLCHQMLKKKFVSPKFLNFLQNLNKIPIVESPTFRFSPHIQIFPKLWSCFINSPPCHVHSPRNRFWSNNRRKQILKNFDPCDLFFRPPALWSSQNVFGPLTMVAAVDDFKDWGHICNFLRKLYLNFSNILSISLFLKFCKIFKFSKL